MKNSKICLLTDLIKMEFNILIGTTTKLISMQERIGQTIIYNFAKISITNYYTFFVFNVEGFS